MTWTLADVLDASRRRSPTGTAVEFGSRRFDYATVRRRAGQLANQIIEAGLTLGDRCAILAMNRIEWLEIYWACALTGTIAVPINFRLSADEIAYIVADCTPRLLIHCPSQSGKLEEAGLLSASTIVSIALSAEGEEGSDYDRRLASHRDDVVPVRTEPGTDLLLIYTSGTTGRPKGAVVAHGALVLNLLLLAKEIGGLGEDDRALLVMPLFHSNSTWFLLTMAMLGASSIIHPSLNFSPDEVLRTIAERRVTFTSLVPTMLTMFASAWRRDAEADPCDSLTRLFCSSAPLMAATREQARAMFPNVHFFEGYGSTETGLTTIRKPEHDGSAPRSVGRPVAGKAIRLVDEDGTDVGQGEVGEVLTRGLGNLMNRYWNNTEATRTALQDGWIGVGDLGRVDEAGFLHLIDRKQDMIISGGENVYPTEVENVLAAHPSVTEVAVVGTHDDLWGEIVHAVVVLRAGSGACPDELDAFCFDRIAGYKRPRRYSFVAALPKNASGKILRRAVRGQISG